MKKKKFSNSIEPYIWLLPSMILMAVFILVPIFEVFRISLSKVSKAGIIKGFVGLDNFRKVLKGSAFMLVLKNTIVWKFIIDTDYGALNTLLMRLGLIQKSVNWTPTPGAYFAWECWVGIFVTVPFVMFCVLSGLQSIDSAYYEAATVDGATYWQKLFQITVPLVRPSLTVSTVLNIIYVFNSFPIIWTITKGDPANRTDTLVTYLYKLAFYNGKSGEAAAVSVIGFLILCACASVYMVVSLRKEGQDE
jgi:multiple sugar transport system permease protein